jgi:spore coat protein E
MRREFMSEIREIVTKAIVEKGKKQIRFTSTVSALNNVESILGCFVLNHSFSANRIKGAVEVSGKFELNCWYSHSSNTKTDVVKQVITYDKIVKTKKTIKSYIEDNNDVIVKMIQQPITADVRIVSDHIEVEIMFEVECEVIGETKIKVNVLEGAHIYDPNEDDDYLDDIDEEINPQFINEKIF